MNEFNPAKPVSQWNYAVEVEFSREGESLIRSEFFGTAKDAAGFIESMESVVNIHGWQGDSATLDALDSFRSEPLYVEPEYITEINVSSGESREIGADEFNRLFLIFHRSENHMVRRWAYPGGHVYAVMATDERGHVVLSSHTFHVPSAADSIIT